MTFFGVCRQKFFMTDTKDSAGNIMDRCCTCREWFHKKYMSISKQVFCSENEHKNVSVVNANCNFHNKTLHI